MAERCFFIRTLKIEHRRYGKVYKAVVGYGLPVQARALRGMLRTASQAEAYGKRAAAKACGLMSITPGASHPEQVQRTKVNG